MAIIKIKREAMSENEPTTSFTKCGKTISTRNLPSQISSDFFQRSEALVNQIAMNVAPMAAAMRKPSAEPAKIWKAV
jgi:hypothetical protein